MFIGDAYHEHYVVFFRGEDERLPFLTAGDEAHKVLITHLQSSNFLKQLAQCTHGQHTGRIEVLHSMFLAYVSKRVDYDPPSYCGRIQLAILDHNENCNRPPIIGKLPMSTCATMQTSLLLISRFFIGWQSYTVHNLPIGQICYVDTLIGVFYLFI